MFLSCNDDTVMVSPQFSQSALCCPTLPHSYGITTILTVCSLMPIITTIFHLLLTQNIQHTILCAMYFEQRGNETFQTQPEVHCMSMLISLSLSHTHTHPRACMCVCVCVCVCIYISTQFQAHHPQHILLTYAAHLLCLQLHKAGT